MRLVTYGAGAIEGLVCARLHQSGHRVTLADQAARQGWPPGSTTLGKIDTMPGDAP